MATSSRTELPVAAASPLVPAATLLTWIWAGLWRDQGARAAIAILAIAIGVALGLAVHLINRSALVEFDQALARINGQAELQVVPVARAFDEALYGRLLGPEGRTAGVRAASPIITVSVRAHRVLPGGPDPVTDLVTVPGDATGPPADTRANPGTVPLELIGIDLFRAAAVTPGLIPMARGPQDVGTDGDTDHGAEGDRRRDDGAGPAEGSSSSLFGDASIFLSPGALKSLGAQVGDTIAVAVGLREQRLKVAGEVAPEGAGPALAVMDIGALQWRFDWLGHLNRIDLRLAEGVDAATLTSRLAPVLGDTARLEAPDVAAQRMSNLSRAYRVNLLVLSLVALFTGAFIVYSTLALAITRQQTSLAMLGVLGASRRLVDAVVLGQGLSLGLAGSLLGLLTGVGIAWLLLTHVGADLGAGYFQGGAAALQIDALPLLLGLAAGLATGWAGACLPLRQLQQVSILARLRGLAAEDRLRVGARGRRRILGLALAWLLAALVLQALPPWGGLPLAAYASIACVLFAGIVAVPLAVRAYGRLLGLVLASGASRETGALRLASGLAVARIRGAPAAATGALSGVVVSFALACAMAIMVGSFRDSVDAWLGRVLPADLYARTASVGLQGAIAPDLPEALARLPGIARVEAQRIGELRLGEPGLADDQAPVTVIARRVERAHPDRQLPLAGGVDRSEVGADAIPIYVSEAMVDRHGLHPGTVTRLPLGPPGTRFVVRAVWRDYARQSGAVVIDRDDYARLTGDDRANDLAIWLAPGTSAAEARATLVAHEPALANLTWRSAEALRELSIGIFDRSFFITYLLEAITLGVGLFGVATGFAADAWARSREFGMLRHLGLSRAGLGLQLALEAGLLVVCALVWGGALGFAIAWILVARVNPQSFHWTMDMSLPVGLIAAAALAMIVLGALTAFLSTRRASDRSPIAAVRADW